QPDVGVEPDGVDVAVLLAAEQDSGAAKFQVERRDLETRSQIAELLQGGQAFSGDFAQFGVRRDQQISVRAAVRTSYAAAKLVQFGEAVALGVFDDDRVRQRDIHPVFYDRSANKNIVLVMHEFH